MPAALRREFSNAIGDVIAGSAIDPLGPGLALVDPDQRKFVRAHPAGINSGIVQKLLGYMASIDSELALFEPGYVDKDLLSFAGHSDGAAVFSAQAF
jgi:hypothetical protein